MSDAFIDHYDAALFDLDGVVYLGPVEVPGASHSLAALREMGVQVGFVTNNAGRSPRVVVDHLNGLGIECRLADVVTSAQAIARVMADELPRSARVYVCGAQSLADEIAAMGMTIVPSHHHQPHAVVQGYDPHLAWPMLDEAAFCLQRGARWYVSNTDQTRPTDLGLIPGAGAQVHAVGLCVATTPVIAGKPYPPLLNETTRRLGCQRPVFVGDRLDTDVEGAHNVLMDSFQVFTGAHGKYDLVAAPEHQRPTAIGYNLQDLLRPQRVAVLTGGQARCGQAVAEEHDGSVQVTGPLTTRDEQFDALWAIAQLMWQNTSLDTTQALAELELVP